MKNYNSTSNSSLNLSESAIREAAYYIWKNNGCPANTSLSDWNAAINQLSSMATLNSAAKKISSTKTSSCKASTLVKKTPVKTAAKTNSKTAKKKSSK